MSWYCYRKYFEKRHSEILPGILKNGLVTNKKAYELASVQIYDEMLQYLSGVSRVNLRKRTQLTKPIYMLFSEIGEDKIMRIKSYSANKLSKLTDMQIDTIKNHFTTQREKNSRIHVTLEMITTTAPQSRMTSKKIVNASQTIPAFSQPNDLPEMISSDMSQASVSSASQSKPAYDHSYFRNKILDQYPNLYRECSSENFDYYGITDETSGDYICPLCKLDYDDEEIEGRYKAGSYFIKCEQREIEIVA
jgi:hypothetical protein